AELVITITGGIITLKLRVPSPPPSTRWCKAPPRSGLASAVCSTSPSWGCCPPTDGWSDITELYVARHGVPEAGKAIWIRTCQHIDGWTDVPKVARARVPADAP